MIRIANSSRLVPVVDRFHETRRLEIFTSLTLSYVFCKTQPKSNNSKSKVIKAYLRLQIPQGIFIFNRERNDLSKLFKLVQHWERKNKTCHNLTYVSEGHHFHVGGDMMYYLLNKFSSLVSCHFYILFFTKWLVLGLTTRENIVPYLKIHRNVA